MVGGNGVLRWMAMGAACLILYDASAFAQAADAPAGAAVIEKPKPRTASAGHCRIAEATFGAVWGPDQLPLLAFTIGPKSAMADLMHADKKPFAGPGVYRNVVIAVYLGKTALDDTHAGLGTVTVNGDGRSGTFVLNDGTTAGHWSCATLAH
jgi:hypothetical protein